MQVVNHNLGKFEHNYPRLCIRSTTEADVTISSSDLLSFPSTTLSRSLDELLLTRAWIKSGTTLEINLVLSFYEVEIEDGSISDHVENLGLLLRNGELWPQLSLTPSLKLPQASQDRSLSSVVICLTLTPSHGINTIPTQTPFLDTQNCNEPPSGILSVLIEKINIHLRISKDPIHRRINLKRKSSHGSNLTVKQNYKRQDSNNHSPFSLTSQTQGLGSQTAITHAPTNACKYTGAVTAFVLPTRSSSIHSQSSTLSQISPTVLTSRLDKELSPPPPPPSPFSQLITFADLAKIVDCSLKEAIFNRQRGAPEGLLLSSSTHYLSLDQISPAIFSPDYYQAISQRRFYLSPLATIISRIESFTRSLSLRQKIRQLKEVSLDRHLPDLTSTCSDRRFRGSSLSEVVEARLWLLMQRNLYNENACSRLKSFIMERKSTDTIDAGLLLDVEGSKADKVSSESAKECRDADLFKTSLEPVCTQDVLNSTRDREDDLLDDELDLREEPFYSLGQGYVDVDNFGDVSYKSSHGDHADDDLFANKVDYQKHSLSRTCDSIYEEEEEDDEEVNLNLLWSGSEDSESLLDGAYKHIDEAQDEDLFRSDFNDSEPLLDRGDDCYHEEDEDEDLFWSGLEDQRDLRHDFDTSTLALNALQDDLSNENSSQDAKDRFSLIQNDDRELEYLRPEDTDSPHFNTGQDELLQGSEMLLEN